MDEPGDGSDGGDNRRRVPRVPTRIEVNYASESTFLFAYITDISSLGIFVETPQIHAEGTSLTLRFAAPLEQGAAFDLRGLVRWTSEQDGHQGMGIEFVELDEATRERLHALVNAVAYLDGP